MTLRRIAAYALAFILFLAALFLWAVMTDERTGRNVDEWQKATAEMAQDVPPGGRE
jgi:hypothetical protein